MKTIKKVTWIVTLKSYAILLVVIGHSFPVRESIAYPKVIDWLLHLIYAFHMPLFIFI